MAGFRKNLIGQPQRLAEQKISSIVRLQWQPPHHVAHARSRQHGVKSSYDPSGYRRVASRMAISMRTGKTPDPFVFPVPKDGRYPIGHVLTVTLGAVSILARP